MAFVTVLLMVPASAKPVAQKSPSAQIRMRTPEPRGFVVDLQEVWLELDARRPPSAGQLRALGTVRRVGPHLIVRVADARSPSDLLAHGWRAQSTIGARELHLVLYDDDAPRDDAHRGLLTREVAVVLSDGARPADVLGDERPHRTVAGVKGGYIVRAEDPIAAVALADRLASLAEVVAAYPLVKRMEFPR